MGPKSPSSYSLLLLYSSAFCVQIFTLFFTNSLLFVEPLINHNNSRNIVFQPTLFVVINGNDFNKSKYDDLRKKYEDALAQIADLRKQLNTALAEIEGLNGVVEQLKVEVDSAKLQQAAAENQKLMVIIMMATMTRVKLYIGRRNDK